MDLLPVELTRLIRDFVMRHDWRTCKLHESRLIKDFNHWTKRVLNDDALDWYHTTLKMEFPIVFSQKELDVYLKEWTLVGRWYLIQRTKKENYWYLSRIAPVATEFNEYAVAFHHLHHGWRRS
jgi:hypothetical protein